MTFLMIKWFIIQVMYFNTINVKMFLFMLIHFWLNQRNATVAAMSRDIVSCVICMF